MAGKNLFVVKIKLIKPSGVLGSRGQNALRILRGALGSGRVSSGLVGLLDSGLVGSGSVGWLLITQDPVE